MNTLAGPYAVGPRARGVNGPDRAALFAKLDEIERLANSMTGPPGGETESDPKRHTALVVRGTARALREAAESLTKLEAERRLRKSSYRPAA
jgi:hypothetical protein